MAKILRVFIILILGFTIAFSSSYMQELRAFDKQYKTASHEKMLKYHHRLKNIYIQSIIKNDLKLKIRALQRLIITSKSLGLSSASYKKELITLKKMAGKKGSGYRFVKKNDTKTNNYSSLYNKKQNTSTKKTYQKQPILTTEGEAKILEIVSQKRGFSLVFNKNVKDIKVKSFVLKGSKTYKYVYDIRGRLVKRTSKLKMSGIEKIRMGQYNKKYTRIVLTSKEKHKLYYSKTANMINIGFKDMKIKKQPKMKFVEPKNPIKKQYDFNPPKKNNKKDIYIPPVKFSKTKLSHKPSSKVIVIDAGHGGKDGGAQGGKGLSEKKIVLNIALRLGRKLKAKGYKVYYTRVKDKFIKLRNRTKMANKKNADLFISIHANAAPNIKKYTTMHGVETFFLSPARSKRSKNVAALENRSDIAEMHYFSKQTFLNFLNREKIISANKLAIDVQQGMLNSLRTKYRVSDGGVREAPFWVLVGAQMPSILIEVGYITHPIEGRRIASGKYQDLLVNGVTNGIISYFDKNN